MTKSILKRSKKRHTAHNTQFLDKPTYLGDDLIPISIKLIQYDSTSSTERNLSSTSTLRDKIDNTKINWFKITGISDANRVTQICQEFDLHLFDVKDLLSEQKIVKVVPYDTVTLILMSAFLLNENDELDEDQIAFIMGENFIVSFQESELSLFDDVQKRISEEGSMIRARYADYLLYILLNAINHINSKVVMHIEDEMNEIEDLLIEGQDTVDILRLLRTRRVDYIRIHRFVLAFREEYNNILHNTNGLIRSKDMIYFNDYDDRLRTILGNLDGFKETLLSLLDLYYNNNNLKMNNVIKRLTIVSTLFIPLTFMVGVWGMNFEFMPETKLKYGYIYSWIILIAIAVGTWLYMKKKKWF